MQRRARMLASLTAVFCIALTSSSSAQFHMRVDGSPLGLGYTGNAGGPAITPDGNYVLFTADGLHLPGNPLARDVYLYERATNMVSLVSFGPGGQTPNGTGSYVYNRGISGDARWIVYVSTASNLVNQDTNGKLDVFLHDRVTSNTELVSVSTSGAQADFPSDIGADVSDDGRYIAFACRANNLVPSDNNAAGDVFLRDRTAGTTVALSLTPGGATGNATSWHPSMSADGRWIVFESSATDLDPTTPTGGLGTDIFLADCVTGTVECISKTPSGNGGNAQSIFPVISRDGRFAVFTSHADDLVAGDTNFDADVFVCDLATKAITRVSISSTGAEADNQSGSPSISADGRFVTFSSSAKNFVVGLAAGSIFNVYLHDRLTGTTKLVPRSMPNPSVTQGGGNAQSGGGAYNDHQGSSVASDGRWVAYHSLAYNLVPGEFVIGGQNVLLTDMQNPYPPLATHCFGKLNSLGCSPILLPAGAPSISGSGTLSGTLLITASSVLPSKPGIFFWGADSAAPPFGFNGKLCVKPPLIRGPVQVSSSGSGCEGLYTFAFTPAYAVSHGLAAGDDFYCQYWSRDRGFGPPDDFGLTNALHVTLGP
jgi:Tol biopolymer transport system component